MATDAMRIAAPLGTHDVLPGEWALWRELEQAARTEFERFGYQEVRTPVFEDTRLFVRGTGETTDIVQKEMYTFGEGDDSITLRPEGTPPIVRSCLEHELFKAKKFQKLYYIGPMFRRERPQAGRLRQFHQMGIEALGGYDPLLDAETIVLAGRVFDRVGLAGYQVKLNSVGCPKCRPGYRAILREKLTPSREKLCESCQARFDRNVFRILDCKRDQCKAICADLPPPQQHACEECAKHFAAVLEALKRIELPFSVEPKLVRGLDYYTKTVYEITHSSLGARDAVCGGGRYDNMVEEFGGPPMGAVGFAIGMEATLLAIRNIRGEAAHAIASPTDVYVICIGNESRGYGFGVLDALRKKGVATDGDYEARSPKAQMRTANKLGVRFAVVVGSDEMTQGVVTVKTMSTGEEAKLPLPEGVEFIVNKLKSAGS